MDFKESGAGLIALIVVVATIWFSAVPPASLNGKDPVPTKVQTHLVRKGQEVDGTLEIKHQPSGQSITVDLADRNAFQSDEQSDDPDWSIRLKRDRYLIDAGLDLGCFAGIRTSPEDGERTIYGLRISPIRVLYGMVAPDLLVTEHEAGIGLSLFPPPDYLHHAFNHLGVGIGRTWSYDGEQEDTLVYLGFSTRF